MIEKNKKDAGEDLEEKLDPQEDGSYNPLHEGEIVNWNESLEPKEEKSDSVDWEERLGDEEKTSHEEQGMTISILIVLFITKI